MKENEGMTRPPAAADPSMPAAAAPAVRPTKKQRALLDFIQRFIDEHGYSPSYREIMNGCGYNSIATVAVHINNLIRRGHLRKRDHSARSLELTGAAVPRQAGANGADSPEAKWLVGKVEALVVQAEALEQPRPADVHDLQLLLAVLPVLEITLPTALQARLQTLESRIQA